MARDKPRSAAVQPVGLVGLGLMGRGIASCLLAHGLQVMAFNRTASRTRAAMAHIDVALEELCRRGVVRRDRIGDWKTRFRVCDSPADLHPCPMVIESVKEDLAVKRRMYDELEAALSPRAIVASNTSSLPISALQSGRKHPARFVGMHWGEPAHIMRYLEIIPGQQTSKRAVRLTRELGELCGKDPTVLRQDIRGFLSNRMMYAMIREACYLVEQGIADIETVDRSFRNDIGWWATFAGPFRWMDLTGIPAYALVMQGLLPQLCHSKTVPRILRDMGARGAQGISNAKGFDRYSRKSAKRWEKAWTDFTFDIRQLAQRYDERRISAR